MSPRSSRPHLRYDLLQPILGSAVLGVEAVAFDDEGGARVGAVGAEAAVGGGDEDGLAGEIPGTELAY